VNPEKKSKTNEEDMLEINEHCEMAYVFVDEIIPYCIEYFVEKVQGKDEQNTDSQIESQKPKNKLRRHQYPLIDKVKRGAFKKRL